MDGSEIPKKQPVTVTRDELYQQVWQTPMSRLADNYGITGNGLAKICDKLSIPYPPRGHWAKKAAGKKVVTYRLPVAGESTPLKVTISPTPTAPKEPALPIVAREAVETTLAAEIKVPEKLNRPHEIIARWLADRELRKQEARRERDPWRKKHLDPGELTQVAQRQHLILDTLFKVLEKQGARIKEGERRELLIELQGEKLEVQLREKQKQVRRPPTAEEKKNWLYRDRQIVQELLPSGKLVFSIKTYLPAGLRQEWIESDQKRLEELLPDILATLVAAGPLLVEQRRNREEAERQRQIVERQRYEEQQRKKRDNNRWRHFIELAGDWRQLEIARAFLEIMKQTDIDPEKEIGGRKIGDWLKWAEGRISATDPMANGVEAIFDSVAAVTEWTYRD